MKRLLVLLILLVPIQAFAFVHPGILNNQAEYNLMRQKVLAGAQPWKPAYDALANQNYLNYTPEAPSTMHITTTGSTGPSSIQRDGDAAYGSALQWIVTGGSAHASKAKQILNAWANNLTSITGDSQQELEISWFTPRLAYTAEILKHVPGSGWSSGEQTAFNGMVNKFFVPRLQSICSNCTTQGGVARNNWAALGLMARMAWGVYLDNTSLFNSGVTGYQNLMTFYVSKFGHNVMDGFTYETCRLSGANGGLEGGDMTHTAMGLIGFAVAAEIGKKQGLDLYGFRGSDDNFGLRTALLAHGKWWDYPTRSGSVNTGWPCQLAFPGRTFEEGAFPNFSWHAMYNHYRDPLLLSLSNFQGNDQSGRRGLFRWDRLTHNYAGLTVDPEPEPEPVTGGVAINSGGSSFAAADGATYGSDTFFSGGTTASTTAAIAGTTDDTLYKSERYGAQFSYNIPIANGDYNVTLKFAEIYLNTAGSRIFSVSIEGQSVISNLDIFATVGANTAHDRSFAVTVNDGTLNIVFTSSVELAKVSAILVDQGVTPPPPPPPPPTNLTIRYASLSGSSTTCSASFPCSVQTAAEQAGGGSTIRVFPGTYPIQIDNWLPSGTASQPTVLESWTGTGTDINVGNREIPVTHAPVTIVASTGQGISIRDGRSHIIVRNINFTTDGTGTAYGAVVGSSAGTSITNNITFENVDFQAPTRTGATAALKIYSTTDRVKIIKSRLHDVALGADFTASGPTGFGLEICGSNHTIEDSDIYNIPSSGIQATPCPSVGNINWRIVNNRIFDIGLTGIFLTQAVDPIISNNQVYDLGSWGIYCEGNSKKCLTFNNLVKTYSQRTDRNNGGIRYVSGATGTVRNNIVLAASGQPSIDILSTSAQVACDNNISSKSSEVTNCTSWTLNGVDTAIWENPLSCNWNLKLASPALDNGVSGICTSADISANRCSTALSLNTFSGAGVDQGPKETAAPVVQTEISQLSFDEDFLDSIGPNDGTGTSVTFDLTNKIAGTAAALFNASTDKVTIPIAGLTTKEMTIVVSARPENLDSAVHYVIGGTSCAPSYCDRLQLYLHTNTKFAVGIGNSHTVLTASNFTPVVDTYVRLVLRLKEGATAGSGTGNLTISGVLVGSFTYSGFNQLTSPITIGNNGGYNNEGWDGQLDELIIANYYWPDSKVQEDFATYGQLPVAPFDPVEFIHAQLIAANSVKADLIGSPDPDECSPLTNFTVAVNGVDATTATCTITGSPAVLNITFSPGAVAGDEVTLFYYLDVDLEPVENLLPPTPPTEISFVGECATDVSGIQEICTLAGDVPSSACDNLANFQALDDCFPVPIVGCSIAPAPPNSTLTIFRSTPPVDGTIPLFLTLVAENQTTRVVNNFVPGSIPPETTPDTTGVNMRAWWCRPDSGDAARFQDMQNLPCRTASPGRNNFRVAIANESGATLSGLKTSFACARDDGEGFGAFVQIGPDFNSINLKYSMQSIFNSPDGTTIITPVLTVPGGLTPVNVGTLRRSESPRVGYNLADDEVIEEEFSILIGEGVPLGTRFVCRVRDEFGNPLDSYVGEAGCETAGPDSADACGALMVIGRPRVR